MPYQDSYVAKIREKIGHEFELVMPTVDVVIANENGELLMIYNRDFDGWAFPGGYIEPEMSWQENAAREALEESGIQADTQDLQLIGTVSGANYRTKYPNGDRVKLYTNVFLLTNWSKELDMMDDTEIDRKEWMTPQTVDHVHLTFSGRAVYQTYRQFQEKGRVQLLTINSELQRFIDAQDGRIVGVNTYNDAVNELSAGRKQTHWMWYVFPQLRGLGTSERAMYYGINGLREAREYLDDDVLRARLEKAVKIILNIESVDAVAVFGHVDAEKLQACLTLFAQLANQPTLYQQALKKYFDNELHQPTLTLLNQ
ncbi:hypothetical protein GCM10025879_10290 [Leuconostoc litchii]|uniref:DUF1810 family protein n=1 Tax=Leuconostoc litchii TaxID=1981069 RepID=A0A6P2CML9_9LACO|nr:DUF1810 family protein [Leuconostoc litchii]TYC46126.1 DUF1810 family protein [Leuconostoc litchii]GMA69783.1 hypothetical protein GCM10025879_10290 [Leuconostoc litchii]